MNFNLIVAPLNDEPVQYELNAKRIGVGRGADNQIVLDFDMVSSSHCEIKRGPDGTWLLEDVGSKNGTRVNGRAVLETVKLQDGDRILIAESIPCHFVALADGEEYEDAVSAGGDSEEVSEFVKLNDKIHELEQDIVAKTLEAETLESHLERLRKEFGTKKEEYEKLSENIQGLEKKIAEGSDEKDIVEQLQSELAEKTQRITVLKSDLDDTESAIDDLEQTRKTTLKAAPAVAAPAPKPAAPAAPAAPAVAKPAAPVAPAAPAAPTIAKPVAPAAAGPVAPKLVTPGAPPKPAAPVGGAPVPSLPKVTPAKKPGDLPLAKPTKPGDL